MLAWCHGRVAVHRKDRLHVTGILQGAWLCNVVIDRARQEGTGIADPREVGRRDKVVDYYAWQG